MNFLDQLPLWQRYRPALLLLLAALLLAACAGDTPLASGPTPSTAQAMPDAGGAVDLDALDERLPTLAALALEPDARLNVAATTNLIADIVAQVGGDRIELHPLMPVGADPHSYTATPQDLRRLNDADVIFVNGLGLEEGLLPLLTNLDRPVPLVSVNVGVETVDFDDDHARDDDEHGHDDDHAHDDDHVQTPHGLAPRLLAIADYEGGVHLLQLDTLEIIDTFALAGPARVYPAFDDRFVFAVQTDHDQINAINSGLEEIGHDDHYHIMLGTAGLAPLVVEGATPIHFAAHGDQVAIFNDGDGTAMLINRTEVLDASSAPAIFESGRAHHGSAVPLHDAILISIPEPDSDAALPIGVAALTLEGEELARFEECPGLHGEASVGHRVVFGCSDGLLVIDAHDDEFEAAKIANPSGEGRTGSFASHPDAHLLLGNYTRFGILVIDPRALTSQLIELPIEIRNFYFHPEHVDEAVVLTVDGMLHVIDLATGEVEASVQVVDSFADRYRDSENSNPLPYLQVAGHLAFVADQAGDIVVVDLDELEIQTRLAPGVNVLSMAAFGRAEAPDALDHRSTYAPDDDHAHDDDDHAPDDDHAHDDDDHAHDDDQHHHDGDDPHTWQSVRNVMVWVDNIESVLSALDPAHADFYAANAAGYQEALMELDAEIRARVTEIPAARRLLVTDHGTFSYFALDYGFEVIGTVIPGFSTLASPSAQELAGLQDQLLAADVPAIFVGTTVNPGLAQRMAEDTGIRVVPLYSDSLSESDGPAASYLEFMRYNVNAIVEALR